LLPLCAVDGNRQTREQAKCMIYRKRFSGRQNWHQDGSRQNWTAASQTDEEDVGVGARKRTGKTEKRQRQVELDNKH
jgi:hypothetical protein